MKAPSISRFENAFFLGTGLALLLHFYITLRAPIIGDEAYYWLWSKHPALGYHDHPPLIGWLIRATTLWSDHPFFVRLPALLCFVGGLLLLYSFARDILGSETKAKWALLLYLYLPILAISSMAVFTDSPLLFSWILAMWAGWKSLRDGRCWLLAGAAIGLATLSKLVGLFLPASFAFFFLISPGSRESLKTKWFWLGLAVAFAVSLPVWIWNLQHGFENVMFQAHEHLGGSQGRPFLSVLVYTGVQLLNASPLLCLFFVVTAAVLIKRSLQGDRASQFLLSFALPIHLAFGVLTLFARVGFHWAAPGYVGLVVAAANLDSWKNWRSWSLGAAMTMTLLIFAVLASPEGAASYLMPLDARHPSWGLASFVSGKGYGEVIGYKQISSVIKDRIASLEREQPTFLLTDSYTLSSVLAFYAQHRAYTVLTNGQGGEYARWDDFSKVKGQNALWVSQIPFSESPLERERLSKAFQRIGKTEVLDLKDAAITRRYFATSLLRLERPALLRSWSLDVPR